MRPYKDFPFREIVSAVEALAKRGAQCFQKFTCQHCGKRLAMDEPNVIYTSGKCDECGHETDIVKTGCNYAVHMRGPLAQDFIEGVWQPADECPYRHKHKR